MTSRLLVAVMVMVVMVVMMMTTPPAMMVVMVTPPVMMVMMILHQRHVRVRRRFLRGPRGIGIHGLQHGERVRNGIEQFGEGLRRGQPRRIRTLEACGLSAIEGGEARDRAYQADDFVHSASPWVDWSVNSTHAVAEAQITLRVPG